MKEIRRIICSGLVLYMRLSVLPDRVFAAKSMTSDLMVLKQNAAPDPGLPENDELFTV